MCNHVSRFALLWKINKLNFRKKLKKKNLQNTALSYDILAFVDHKRLGLRDICCLVNLFQSLTQQMHGKRWGINMIIYALHWTAQQNRIVVASNAAFTVWRCVKQSGLWFFKKLFNFFKKLFNFFKTVLCTHIF